MPRISRRLIAVAASTLLLVLPQATGPAQAATSGSVLAWGWDMHGQLGDFGGAADQSVPVMAAGGHGRTAVAAGSGHSLLLLADGSVMASGYDIEGQLGDGGTNANKLFPVPVTGLGPGSGVVAIAAADHSLALRSDGSVLAWGTDRYGQLGDGGSVPDPHGASATANDRSTPVPVVGLGAGSGAVAVSAGTIHSLALLSDGTVLAWGGDVSGRLGDGRETVHQSSPVQVTGLGPGSGVVAISAGRTHSLALRADGSVITWGGAGWDLDDPTNAHNFTPAPVEGLPAGSGIVAVSAGGTFNLALRSDGTVLAWGFDGYGRLGDGGADTYQANPVVVRGLGAGSGAVAISAGDNHSLALKGDGSVLAWGNDQDGKLGDGCAEAHRSSPVAVSLLGPGSGVVAVDAGHGHSLALTTAQSTWPKPTASTPTGSVGPTQVSGLNNVGQLGAGATAIAPTPTNALVPPGTTDVAAGHYHSVARRDDGRVWTWGWNATGQLGDGTLTDRRAPAPVAGLTRICAIAAGALHTLSVANDGTVWAWGWNGVGQLGTGNRVDQRRPVQVPGLTNVIAVAAGNYHSLALLGDGSVWSWGWNGQGQLGDSARTDRSYPLPVLRHVMAVAAGGYHNVAHMENGTVQTWGWNVVGQLGLGHTREVVGPAVVPALQYTGTTSVAAGELHSLAATGAAYKPVRERRAVAWGWNAVGQLGDGTTVDRHAPVPVTPLENVKSVAAGRHHSFAVRHDTTVAAWGWNAGGQLGDGTVVDRHRPVDRPVPPGAPRLSGGVVHTLAASG